MPKHKKILSIAKQWNIDLNWTLFLDRDGVINTRLIGDYVKNWSEFEWVEGVLAVMPLLANHFHKIVVVTNQQGVGKGKMSAATVERLHQKMIQTIENQGGRIDAVYYCPSLVADNDPWRKPDIGMGLQAQKDFPSIDFQKAILVGDSASDIEFGNRLGMKTIFIKSKPEDFDKARTKKIDLELDSLAEIQYLFNSTGK